MSTALRVKGMVMTCDVAVMTPFICKLYVPTVEAALMERVPVAELMVSQPGQAVTPSASKTEWVIVAAVVP